MKLPEGVKNFFAPLNTPIGVLGAALIALNIVRGVSDMASSASYFAEVWPIVWTFIKSPVGTLITIVIGLVFYWWGGRRARSQKDRATLNEHTEDPRWKERLETLDAMVAHAPLTQEIFAERMAEVDSKITDLQSAASAATPNVELLLDYEAKIAPVRDELAELSAKHETFTQYVSRHLVDLLGTDSKLVSESISADLDLKHLLWVVTFQAAIETLEGLLREVPSARFSYGEGTTDHQREETYTSYASYLANVSIRLNYIRKSNPHPQAILVRIDMQQIHRYAESVAKENIEAVAPAERPHDVKIFDLLRYVTVTQEVAELVRRLRYNISQLQLEISNYDARLLEARDNRSPPTNRS